MASKHQFYSILLIAFGFFFNATLAAQKIDSTETSWNFTLGIGTDITQLLQINPKVGAGENRFGLGWVINSTAHYKKNRLAWDNNAIWSFSIQKQGGGFIASGDEKIPFQKSIDELRIGSKVGYKFKKDSKFFYAADFSFLSQAFQTYSGNYLRDIQEPETKNDPISRFLSPGQLTLSIGIDYKPSDNLSIFLSPVGYKSLIVLDDDIADDVVQNNSGEITGSVHGNPITIDESKMNLLSYQNIRHEMGSLLRATYQNKFIKNKISLKSELLMYLNYLDDLRNVDYQWTNEINFVVLKGLHISLFTTMFYDYDIFSYKTNYSQPGGIEPTPQRNLVSFTEQFVIKYNIVF